jgi:16S rRNA (cytidine1402-2'-O)-methyltransferase
MAGTLHVVATPIGNLEDVTVRALRVLRECHLIAAEDTRRTAKLLSANGIRTPTVSFHEHNTRTRLPQLLGRLERGDDLALVSDAGTPGLSDPGLELIQACVEKGISVDPLPGANAPVTALLGSGFPIVPFTVFGFPPKIPRFRRPWFREIVSVKHTFCFFESPHRIRDAVRTIAEFSGERQIVIAREMTKIHQEFLRGTASDLSQTLSNPIGEMTVVVSPKTDVLDSTKEPPQDAEVASLFGHITQTTSCSRRKALFVTAERLGITPNMVYAAVERAKKNGVGHG